MLAINLEIVTNGAPAMRRSRMRARKVRELQTCGDFFQE
jgi:hypothetical protein